MARWRLTAPHYINVPGTEWEYRETDRNTGKQARRVYEVPLHLDPDMPSDWNYPNEIIVCHDGKGQPRDLTFLGDPTPDMEPIDDEAKAISDRIRATGAWNHPVESLAATGSFGESLIEAFQKQISAIAAGQNVSTKGVDPDAFAKLQQQVQELMAQNAKLSAKLVEKRV